MYHRLYLYAADGVTNLASTGGYDSISVTKAGLAAGTFLVRVEHYQPLITALIHYTMQWL